MRALLCAAIALASCRSDGTSYVVVEVGAGAALTVSTLDVTVANAGDMKKLTIAKGAPFAIPPPQTFSIEFAGDRAGDVTVDVTARDAGGQVLAHTAGATTIKPGATASLTVSLSAGTTDMASPADMAVTPDLGCSPACKLGQVCNAGACQEKQVTCASMNITCKQPGCFEMGRYSVSDGGGIVVDLTNGRRLWTRATRGPLTHTNAANDCLGLVVEGINGWRLPTYTELTTTLYMAKGLMGCPVCDPAVDQAAFNDTPDSSAGQYYLSDTFGTNGWETTDYCTGRKVFPVDNATPTTYRCTRDPLP